VSDDSNPEGDTAKILGVIASVLAILAFLGIANWEDLTNTKLPWSGGDDVDDIAGIEVGDCFEDTSDPVPIPCDEVGLTYEVLARVPYDESNYERYWGSTQSSGDGATEGRYEATTCAVTLGWNLDLESWDYSRGWVSIYTDNGREVLCYEKNW
jgi:hypothetical protein